MTDTCRTIQLLEGVDASDLRAMRATWEGLSPSDRALFDDFDDFATAATVIEIAEEWRIAAKN